MESISSLKAILIYAFFGLFVVSCTTSVERSDEWISYNQHFLQKSKALQSKTVPQPKKPGKVSLKKVLANGKSPPNATRQQASVMPDGRIKNGFHVFNRDCAMQLEPTDQSQEVGRVRKGKRLWVDGHDANWIKVFKKSGPVYLKKECIEPQ